MFFLPVHNSLFIVGHGHNQQVAEISIPEIINSHNISELNTAGVVQDLVDITEGNLANLGVDDDYWPIVHVYKFNVSQAFNLLLHIPSILPKGSAE